MSMVNVSRNVPSGSIGHQRSSEVTIRGFCEEIVLHKHFDHVCVIYCWKSFINGNDHSP